MQDVHWGAGLFGYFPCYTLGAMYAAQWFAAIRRGTPDLDARIARGDLAPVFDWLRANIWQQASRWTTGELALRASGETLNPTHFRRHPRDALPGPGLDLRSCQRKRGRRGVLFSPPCGEVAAIGVCLRRRRLARRALGGGLGRGLFFAAPVLAAAVFAAALARVPTCALSASMRSISACTSFDDGTPSFFSALAVRSSKIVSSLSHCLPALAVTSSAMLVILLVTSPNFSSATPLRLLLQRRAFLDEGVEHLLAFGLRLGEGAHAGEPDLLRRFLDRAGERAVEQAGAGSVLLLVGHRLEFLDHVMFS